MEALLGLVEGPIEGLSNGLKSFYVGDTQLENNLGTMNFEEFTVDVFPGEVVDPEVITMALGGASRSKSVSVNLFSGTPVIRQTLSGDIDFIDIRMVIQSLYLQNDSGVFTSSLSFTIEYKALSDADWTLIVDANISGKTTSAVVKEYRFAVARIAEPYEIRVIKTSAEGDSVSRFGEVTWESFQEIDATTRSFPGTACTKLLAKTTDQFSSIPEFWAIYKLRIIKVPSNYDPIARTYDGVWDGTFKLAWSNNPAWCLYDFLTNTSYGVSSYYPVTPDKWDFYEGGQWCDQAVPDGKGGTRPRYTLNTLISDPRQGPAQARYMAGLFNAMLVDDADGNVRLKLDKDDPALHLFTPENVVNGDFSYSFTDPDTRFNDYTVSFTNPDLNWEDDRRRVYDQDDIDKNGRVPTDFAAVGCTNDSEAISRTRYKLITGLTEKMQVSFQTGRQGQSVQPFDVMLVADPDMGYALTGRVKSLSADRKTVYLRDALYLEVGVDYEMSLMTQAGVITRAMSSATGSVLQFSVDTALPEDLPEFCTFSVGAEGSSAGSPKPFRVLTVKETSKEVFEIAGIEINRNKWTDIDNATSSGVVEYSSIASPLVVPSPDDVRFMNFYVRATNDMHLILTVTLNRNAFPYYSKEFEVYSRLAESDDAWEQRSLLNGDTLVNHPPGNYEFAVLPKTYLGTKTPLNQARIWTTTVTSVKAPPADVSEVRFRRTAAGREVICPYTDTVGDLAGFRVRYHFGVNDSWGDAISAYNGLVQTFPFNIEHLPKGQLTIMVKAVDFSDVESVGTAVAYLSQGDTILTNVVETYSEAPSWLGQLSGGDITDDELVAGDNGSLFWKTSSSKFWGVSSDPFWQETWQRLSYRYTVIAPASSWMTLSVDLIAGAYSVKYLPPSTASFWGSPSSTFWGAGGDVFWDVGSQMSWPGQLWVEEGERYEVEVTIPSSIIRGKISNISTTFDMEDIEEYLENVVISSEGTRLPITKLYAKIKVARIDIQEDGGDAAYVKIIDYDPELGPLIRAFNLAGEATSALINVLIQGY